ncbi:MAG: NFACT family protein [Synechococcus sp.]
MAGSPLQQIDLTTLRALLSDLRSRALPSRFEKAQQSDSATLQLGFRSLQGMTWLELSWQADCPRLMEIPAPAKVGAGSTLAQQLQHGLRQLALVELQQQGFERVVEFRMAARPGDAVQRTLVLELMGRHSNLLLLDERRRVIALGRQVRAHQSRVRPISTGDPYIPPPPLAGFPPDLEETSERWKERLQLLPLPLKQALQQSYQGISPALAQQLAGPLLSTPVHDLSTQDWMALHERWTRWLSSLASEHFGLILTPSGGYSVWSESGDSQPTRPPLALALGCWYNERLNQRQLSQQLHEVRQRLQRWQRKEQEVLEDQSRRLDNTADADALQQKADAILCLPTPNREQVDEAQTLYRRARKLRRSVAILKERQAHHRQRLELIDQSAAFIDDLEMAHWEALDQRVLALQTLRLELDDLLTPTNRREQRRQQRAQRPAPLELTTVHGLTIQVGRNHRQNEWISLRQARSGDLWFHAQECPGSHVVLKASEAIPSDEDLQLAADLAALFSRGRGNIRVPIVMVPTDDLQRIAGAGPGTVRHRGGEVQWGNPQRGREHLAAAEAPSLDSPGV